MSDVIQITNGPYKQNCFVVIRGAEVLIVDPGSNDPAISETLEARGVTPLAIVNTHGHIDHIGGVAALKARYGIPFYLHGGDAALVRRAALYRAFFKAADKFETPAIDHDLCSGEIEIGPFRVEIIETPGHSEGGVCLRIGSDLFTGDTLFARGHGGTRLPGGNAPALERSFALLRGLDPALTIHPGHGAPATLKDALNSRELDHA